MAVDGGVTAADSTAELIGLDGIIGGGWRRSHTGTPVLRREEFTSSKTSLRGAPSPAVIPQQQQQYAVTPAHQIPQTAAALRTTTGE